MINVLIVDDHAIVRRGLRQILAGIADMTVDGEASNGMEALEQVRRGSCDVVLLDISMPGLNGIDLLKRIRHERPALPVLILSMHGEDQFAVRALRAGASGYLTKESAPELLVAAIRKAAGGGKHISAGLAERLAGELDSARARPVHDLLSDREHQILRLIVAGNSLTEIAAQLSLSVKTVSTHKSRMMQKMNIRNNAELIQYAIEHKLTE